MKNKKFAELEPAQRAEALRMHASQVERQTVDILYTEDEINQIQGRISVLQMRNCEIEDHIADFVKPLQEEVKSIKTETRILVGGLKVGCRQENREVFVFNNADKRISEVYDIDGKLIETREYKPAQQATVFDMQQDKAV